MWRAIKALVFLTALGAVGLIGYAYVGPIIWADDFAPPLTDVSEPVTLDLD